MDTIRTMGTIQIIISILLVLYTIYVLFVFRRTSAKSRDENEQNNYKNPWSLFVKCWRQWKNFRGRARRKEYWFFQLFLISIPPSLLILFVLDSIINKREIYVRDGYQLALSVSGLLLLIRVMLSILSVTVRRLHDIGKSGLLLLLILIPFVGWLIILILMLSDSNPGTNKWGPNPKGIYEQNNKNIEIKEVKEEIKQCPYCGEKILAVAKKCKHCGEWVDKEANVPQKNEAPIVKKQEEETIKGKPTKKKPVAAIVGGVIGVIVLIFVLVWGTTKEFDKRDNNIPRTSFSGKIDDEQLRKEIVGSYSYSDTDDSEEDVIITVNGTTIFNANGYCEDYGEMIYSIFDEYGDKSTVKYRLEARGKYEIKNSYIIYDYKLGDIDMKLTQSNNYELSEVINEHYIPQIKRDMVIDNKEKIIELTDKYLKTEMENDGEKTIVIYVRQS